MDHDKQAQAQAQLQHGGLEINRCSWELVPLHTQHLPHSLSWLGMRATASWLVLFLIVAMHFCSCDLVHAPLWIVAASLTLLLPPASGNSNRLTTLPRQRHAL